jgi:hypothetical protein
MSSLLFFDLLAIFLGRFWRVVLALLNFNPSGSPSVSAVRVEALKAVNKFSFDSIANGHA